MTTHHFARRRPVRRSWAFPAVAAAVASVAVVVGATPAAAHPGHGAHAEGGFGAGLLHPLTGVDHLAAILAVGALAVLLPGRRAIWAVPAAFVAGGLVAGIVGLAGSGHRAVELAIGVSVLALGIGVVAAIRETLVPIVVAVVAAAGAAHGYAHGTELPATGAVGYALGIVVATAGLLAGGIVIGVLARRSPVVRVSAGWVAAAAGLAFIAGA